MFIILHNLPTQPTPFVGRLQELEDIARLLTDPACRLLMLFGPGGDGKTRLAIEAAKHTSFPNGACLIPLQPLTSSDFIVPAIADSLKFSFYGDQNPKTQLLDYLHEKHLLLMLDNFEHLIDGVSLLPEILEAAPEVKILVTSRERLHLREEWVFDVGGLSFPENGHDIDLYDYSASQLFTQHASRAGYVLADSDTASIVHICQLVEGIPLAIELAAAWVRVMPCAEIAHEIAHSLDILTTTTRNVPEKHRSMRATFEHSWRLLSEKEQDVFRRLSVFRGGCTREAAEDVAETSLAILASLVDRSLLRVDNSGRYSLQELLRQYAEYQLERSGEAEAARDAHCAYYAAFLHQRENDLKGPNQIRALNEIAVELDNVRASWRWAVSHRNEQNVKQSLDSLARFYQMRSYYMEGEEVFRMAVDRFGDVENELLAQLLMLQGWFCQYGDRNRELECIQKGMMLLRHLNVYVTMPMPLRQLLYFANNFGGYEAVQEIYREHLNTAREKGDGWGAAWALHCTGELALHHKKYAEAQPFYQESLGRFRAMGDRWGSSWPTGGLGLMAQKLNDYKQALQYHREHLALCKEVGDTGGIVFALGELVFVARALGEPELSKLYLGEYLKFSPERSHWKKNGKLLISTAQRLMIEGQAEQAVEYITLVNHHQLAPGTMDTFPRWLDLLKAELPPEVFAAAVQRGEARDLDGVVKEILADLSSVETTASLPSLHPQPVIDAISSRELEVLRLVAAGLSNAEIALALHIALTTVKTHTRNIFSKLDVSSRTQAVAQAQKLKLL